MNPDQRLPNVLVIDDERQIRRLLRVTLEGQGYTVNEAATAEEGLRTFAMCTPQLIILDLGLPDRSGLEVLKQLRGWNSVPVLILSVFGQEGSKIAALDAGADDYLTKPFSGGELLARLRALQRRIRPVVTSSLFRFGAIEIDFTKRYVTKNGRQVKLTNTEYAMLEMFVTHRGKVLTHTQLLRQLWGPRAETYTHYLRSYMLRLRRKLEEDVDLPRFFRTESGIGYRFVTDPES